MKPVNLPRLRCALLGVLPLRLRAVDHQAIELKGGAVRLGSEGEFCNEARSSKEKSSKKEKL
ncbi:MAG: hypothetical protein K0R17_79 [Rariglobus sp.]|jgi:hypothetical protein|nr:hypothetical protein [Rariglobus sp.]